jgi:hypothetical protein
LGSSAPKKRQIGGSGATVRAASTETETGRSAALAAPIFSSAAAAAMAP